MSQYDELIKSIDLDALRRELASNAEDIDTTIAPTVDPFEDEETPEIKIEPTPNKSLVDSIIEIGDDPNRPLVPEDKYKLPKQLTTIDSLRKKGFDNERIFDAMEELEKIEAEKEERKKNPVEGPADPNVPKIQIQEDDDYIDRLTKGTRAYFVAGGLKQTIGGALQNLAVTQPGPRIGRGGRVIRDFTQEEALERTLNNPLFKAGQNLYKKGIEDFASRPDLQPTDNFMDYEWSDPRFVASAVGQAIPSFLTFVVPSAVVAVTTRNPSAVFGTTMATAFNMEAGNMYNEGIDAGLTPQEASVTASTVGTINALLSNIPAGAIFTKLGLGTKAINDIMIKGAIRRQLFANGTKKAIVGGASEIVEELLQEATNIYFEINDLGKTYTEEEIIKRLQAVSVGGGVLGGTTGSISGAVQTGRDIVDAKIRDSEGKEAVIVETQAKMINDDEANDYNIEYNRDDTGSRPITESELVNRGYDPKQFPEIGENENGEKEYAVRVNGTTDSKGNISLSGGATGSTILEEIIESRVKKLRNSKNTQERALADRIEIWARSVRKKASEMGLELRFKEEGEGNLELFSDAILYTKGGFKGLDQKYEDSIYIPDDLANEFIATIGEMSDGTKIFDALKSDGPGISPNQEFASRVDAEIQSQMFPGSDPARGPPKKTFKRPKSKKSKTSNQIVGDRNTDSPAFKKWFGDSIVKNEDGSPMVVYHGTNKVFDNFDSYLGANFFSVSADDASRYSEPDLYSPSSPNVMPVYLSVKNPLNIIDEVNKATINEEGLQVGFQSKKFVDELSKKDERFKNLKLDDMWDGEPFYSSLFDNPTEDNFMEFVKDLGYDGIVLEENNNINYAVFDPSQIKSTFNKGTFDPNDSNISNQLEPGIVEEAVNAYPDVPTGSKSDLMGKALKRINTKIVDGEPVGDPIPLMESVGRPKNVTAKRIELKDGSIIYVGADQTADQWLEQVNSILSEEEQRTAMNWYEDAYPAFLEYFGEENAVPYMVSWLMGNLNASPQVALSNLYLSLEQLKAEFPSIKRAGLNDENIKKVLAGERTEKGLGIKLFDFMDSALGKPTRTIMQDNPNLGQAVAVDRHTVRDMGFVDSAMKNALMRLALNPLDVRSIKIDMKAKMVDVIDKKTGKPKYKTVNIIDKKTGKERKSRVKQKKAVTPPPSEPQYEWGSRKMNELSADLNAMGYMGGNVNAWQHQAIGWTAIAKALQTSEGMSVPESFQNQEPTIAFEVNFGQDTPYAKKFGDAYNELTLDEQQALTDELVNLVVPDLAKDIGLNILEINQGVVGGWEGTVSANQTMTVRGSNQAIKGMMYSLGLLFQQDSIGSQRIAESLNGAGLAFHHPSLADPNLAGMVYKILEEELPNEVVPGFYMRENFTDKNVKKSNEQAMVIGTYINKNDIDEHGKAIKYAIERINEELDIDMELPVLFGQKYEGISNKWSESPEGEKYNVALTRLFGKSLSRRLSDNYAPRVEKRLRERLLDNKREQLKSYQIVPDFDLGAEKDALSRISEDYPLDLSEENYTSVSGIKKYLLRKIVDSMDPVLSLQEDIRQAYLGDFNLREIYDVHMKAELSVGRIPELIKDFNAKTIDGKNSNSFVSRLYNDLEMDIDEFSEYLHAKHAEVRNKHIKNMSEEDMENGSGMSSAEAKRIRSKYNKKYGLKKLNKYVKEFRETFIDPEVKLRYESGLISKEDYDNLIDPSVNPIAKNYVPLFREQDDPNPTVDSSRGQGFNVKGKEYKKAIGSEKKVRNIVISATERMHSAIIRSEKNAVNKTLLNLVESFPSSAYEVRSLPYKPTYGKDGEILYLTPLDSKQLSDGTTPNETNTVNVKVDGKVKQIVFKGDQGVKIARAMKDMGVARANKTFMMFNTYLRYVNTIYNPDFITSNFVRDLQTAGVNITAFQGEAIRGQALTRQNIQSAWRAVFDVERKNETDSEWADLYNRMKLAGGKTGFFDLQTIEDKIAKMNKNLGQVERTGSGVAKAGKAVVEFIEDVNEATESAVRLTLFKAMLDAGYSEAQSASGAKNVTINFNRKGEWGNVINSLYLFANAGIQGSMKVFSAVKNSKKARKAMAGLVALGMTESLYNHIADTLGDDDDEYEKLPDFERDNYFIARYSKTNYFKFRMPYGFNVFKVAGNIGGDALWARMNDEPFNMADNSWRFLNAFFSAFSPLGTGPFAQISAPTIIDPFIQISTNSNFYGAPIYPQQYKYMDADVINYWKSNPQIFNDTAEGLFRLYGGNIVYDMEGNPVEAVRGPGPGSLIEGDVSPETLEFFVNYLGGGLMSTISRTIETGRSFFDKDTEFTVNNTPIVRQFFGEYKKDSEKRLLYEYEKNSKRTVYSDSEAFKYYAYVQHALKKGSLTPEEHNKKIREFKANQDNAKQIINMRNQ